MVTTDGEPVRGHVLSGTLHAGDTVIWAYVEGRAAEVVAYDAAGEVIEDHPLESVRQSGGLRGAVTGQPGSAPG